MKTNYPQFKLPLSSLLTHRNTVIIFCVLLSTVSGLSSELGELQVTPLPEGSSPFVVRDPQSAVLVVQTSVNPLSFECNMGIIKVDNPNPGEYRIHLFSGTNLVTFKSDNFLPIRERFYLEPKSAVSIRVSARKKGSSIEERPEIRLIYSPLTKSERVRGSIDDRILNLDFSYGSVLLKPEIGKHKVRLINNGRVWEKEYSLEIGERVEDSVWFSSEVVVETVEERPGGIYISSTIPSLKVYLNDVYQGLTPLTLDSVSPGAYEMRLERNMFQPKVMDILVKPLDYAAYEVSLLSNYAYLRIDSDPSGAQLQIDAIEKGLTPYVQQRIDSGTYLIRLSKPFYQILDTTIEMSAGDSVALTMKMIPRFGKLVVNSDPVGALVSLDGRDLGVTPLTYDTLVSGYHMLTISSKHYIEQDDNFQISDGETLTKEFNLAPNFATLNVLGSPTNAVISLEGDEKVTGNLPFSNLKLIPGIYKLTVKNEGYAPYGDIVMLDVHDNDTVVVDLTRLTGLLQVSSYPQGAKILLDGEEVGITPAFLHEVPTGEHSLILDKKGFDVAGDTVIVGLRELASVNWKLSAEGTIVWRKKRLTAVTQSIIVPGLGRMTGGGPILGSLYLASFGAMLYQAFEAKSDHLAQRDIYNRELSAYLAANDSNEISALKANAKSSYDEMNNLNEKWKLYLLTAAGIYTLQLTDAWLFGGGERPRARAAELQMGTNLERDNSNMILTLSVVIPVGRLK